MSILAKEEFNKGPSQGSLRHRGVGGRHLNPDDLVSDGRQSAIGPSWRRVAAQIGEGLATSSRSPHIRENTSATSLSYFQGFDFFKIKLLVLAENY